MNIGGKKGKEGGKEGWDVGKRKEKEKYLAYHWMHRNTKNIQLLLLLLLKK